MGFAVAARADQRSFGILVHGWDMSLGMYPWLVSRGISIQENRQSIRDFWQVMVLHPLGTREFHPGSENAEKQTRCMYVEKNKGKNPAVLTNLLGHVTADRVHLTRTSFSPRRHLCTECRCREVRRPPWSVECRHQDHLAW